MTRHCERRARRRRHKLLIGIFVVVATLGYYLPVFTDHAVPVPVGPLSGQMELFDRDALAEYARAHLTHGPGDAILYFLPHHLHLWRAFNRGVIPLWEPYTSCGHPFLAEAEPGVLYPPRLLSVFFPPYVAFALQVVLSFLLRMLGMILFLRTLMVGLPLASAAGYCYAISGYFTAWNGALSMTDTVGWLPWLLFFFEQARRHKAPGYVLLASAAVACQFFTGHTHMALYNLMALAVYALCRGLCRSLSWRTLGLALLMVVTGVLLAAPQLLSSYELFTRSWRLFRNDILTLPFAHTLLYLHPHAYGDQHTYHGPLNYTEATCFVTTVMLFFAFSAFWRRPPHWRPIAGVLLLGALLTYSAVFNHSLAEVIPFLTHMHHRRASVLVQFALIVLGTLALNHEHGRHLLLRFVTFVSVVTLMLMFLPHVPLSTEMLADALGPVAIAFLLIRLAGNRQRWRTLAIGAIALIAVGEALWFTATERCFAPRTMLTAIEQEYAELTRDLPALYRVRTFGRQEVLFPGSRLWQRLHGIGGYQTFGTIRFGELYERCEPEEAGRLSLRLCRLTSVRYLYSGDTLSLPREQQVTPSVALYRVPETLPRASLFFTALPLSDDATLAALTDTVFPYRQVLLLPAGTAPGPRHDTAAGSATISDYREHNVTITVQADAPGWLLLTDSWDPWWRATVNGADRDVVRANHVFRAVRIPPGQSTVHFFYRPLPFYLGLLVAAATLLVAVYFIRRR